MATKKKTPKRKATDRQTPAMAAGHALAAAFRQECCNIKDPSNPKQNMWGTLSEVQQLEILERFERITGDVVAKAFDSVLSNGFPAVYGTLSGSKFTAKGINCSVEVNRDSRFRHELSDLTGKDVLILLADSPAEYLESMKMVTPDRDQKELPLAPAVPSDETVDDDPRTMEELQTAAGTLAETIGEKDIPGLVGNWTREHLLDYVAYAEGKAKDKAESQGAGKTH